MDISFEATPDQIAAHGNRVGLLADDTAQAADAARQVETRLQPIDTAYGALNEWFALVLSQNDNPLAMAIGAATDALRATSKDLAATAENYRRTDEDIAARMADIDKALAEARRGATSIRQRRSADGGARPTPEQRKQ